MKQFYISALLFLLLICSILGNAVYIHGVAKEILQTASALQAGDPLLLEKCAALQEDWEKQVGTVGLSVSYLVVDRISEQAASLVACAASGDRFGFEVAKALLIDGIGDMTRLEKISIENLL